MLSCVPIDLRLKIPDPCQFIFCSPPLFSAGIKDSSKKEVSRYVRNRKRKPVNTRDNCSACVLVILLRSRPRCSITEKLSPFELCFARSHA